MSVNLRKGTFENDSYKRCEQTMCGYYTEGGCQACDSCGSEPYEINKGCDDCFACENIPDRIRFGDKKPLANKACEADEELLRGEVEQCKILLRH